LYVFPELHRHELVPLPLEEPDDDEQQYTPPALAELQAPLGLVVQ
jgi:hypothetical protein